MQQQKHNLTLRISTRNFGKNIYFVDFPELDRK
jgi:hypothetical protein